MNAVLDPMEAAVKDAENASHVFGQMMVDAQFVVWKKGERIRAWVEGESTENRTTQLTFRMNPLDLTGMTRMIEKQAIAIFSDWTRIIWPSLRDLGCKTPKEIEGKWAHAQLVPKQQDSPYTTFKFIAIYDNEADCIKAWENQFGSSEAHTPSSNGNGAAQAVSQPNDAERTAALSFLPAIVNANKSDLTKLAAALAGMSPLNKYFTIDSPEVQALLGA